MFFEVIMAKPTTEEIQSFSIMIEQMASNLKCTLLDAILLHCQDTDLDIEVASTLITGALKSRIREQSEKENLVKKSSRLPV